MKLTSDVAVNHVSNDREGKQMSKARPRLHGYMILEEWCDDYSDWTGIITGPNDPTGANLAWENPIKMQEVRPGEITLTKDELLRAFGQAYCSADNAHKVLDSEVGIELARILFGEVKGD